MDETHSLRTGLLGFVVGCVLTAAVGGIVIAQLQKNSKQEMDRSTELVGQLQNEKVTCEAKFQRSTVLYDGGIFSPNRRWIIPADVEPVYVGKGGSADYTHLDLKTQTETVHMKPQQQ